MKHALRIALSSLALLTMLHSTPTDAKERHGLKKGMLFTSARAMLLKNGWSPHQSKEGKASTRIGVDNLVLEAGIPELEFCFVDVPICQFQYAKRNTCIRIETWGEEPATMTIHAWRYKCEP